MLVEASSNSGSSAIGIVAVILIICFAAGVVALYMKNEKFREALLSIGGSSGSPSKWQITAVSEDVFAGIMGAIANSFVSSGYTPVSQSGNVYVYQKQEMETPSAIIALLLFCICIIPMIIYLAKGHKMVVKTVTVQVSGTADGGHIFNVKGPGAAKRMVKKIIAPYLPVPETTPTV